MPDGAVFDPALLAELHSLDVAARALVEGLRSGQHRSPLRGHSVDFADHRPYVAGDDVRHLDWKVLARRDRLVLKRYEAELDLGCTLVVDGSGSMAYQGDRAPCSKYRYAALLAAALGYLVLHQNDRAGLLIFSESAVTERIPAGQGQFERICRDLAGHLPQQGAGTKADALARLAQPSVRKGLVVCLSDALVDPATLVSTLDRLRHRGHDLALIWILDPDERDLGVGVVSRFFDLEGDEEIVAEPRALRAAYVAEVERYRLQLTEACRARQVVLVEAATNQSPARILDELLVGLRHS